MTTLRQLIHENNQLYHNLLNQISELKTQEMTPETITQLKNLNNYKLQFIYNYVQSINDFIWHHKTNPHHIDKESLTIVPKHIRLRISEKSLMILKYI